MPRTKQVEAEAKEDDDKDEKLTEEQKKAKEAAEKAKAKKAKQAMTKLADDLRARAAKGEDLAKLQKEAFEAGGNEDRVSHGEPAKRSPQRSASSARRACSI